MGKMKKIMVAGAVCYVAYKLGKKYLRENGLDIDLVITGGLRTSRDFVKALAMGENFQTGRRHCTRHRRRIHDRP